MDTFEFKPTEGFKAGEAAVGMEAQALATATFEPEAFVEETAEVQQAEVLQVSLEAVVASLPGEETMESTPPREPMEASDIPLAATSSEMPWKDVGGGFWEPPVSSGSDEVGEKPEDSIREELSGKIQVKLEGDSEIPLPGTGEVEYKEAPERLDVELPVQAEPLTGVGARGNVDATQGFATELPLGIPEIDVMPGTSFGRGGPPKAVGNMPMAGGKMGGGSGIPDLGIPGMPTSGGPSSSGSGPAMIGGAGTYADGESDAAIAAFFAFFTGEDSEIGNEFEGTMTVIEPAGGVKGAVIRAEELLEQKRAADGKEHTMRLVIESGDERTTYTVDTELGAHKEEVAFIYNVKRSQEPEGDSNPHPYTGGSMGPVLPEKDNDTGKVLPDADLGGFDGTVWKGTPDSDDSGKFYGGILGGRPESHPDSGGARPIDPKRKTEDEGEAADKAG